MIFRFHRGSLSESLKTSCNVNNINELYEVIYKSFSGIDISDLDIKNLQFIDYGFDKRINSYTYLVYLKNFGVIGAADSLF